LIQRPLRRALEASSESGSGGLKMQQKLCCRCAIYEGFLSRQLGIDSIYGPDYCYVKIKGNDGNLYILRFDEARTE
jgi:hypothetical protein